MLFQSYLAGHICFFQSADIYHLVSTFFSPDMDPEEDACTPGRIGSVFFFPEHSLNVLEKKAKGYAMKGFGRHPNPL